MAYKHMFFDDYSEGAHPRILEAFVRTNLQQERGYARDSFAIEATKLIRGKLKNEEVDVHFVSSGTHANLTCLAAMLRPYESVIAVTSGHVSHHEAGAIEATGHKINAVNSVDGKLVPEEIIKIVESHGNDEQMVRPGVVYISQSTELGTIYTKQELETIAKLCKKYGLYFYIDGARLGHALTSLKSDFDITDIARLADIFYIGGTKNGALIGEAIVIVNPALKENFRRNLRQRGALLAKARAVTVQFAELFKDNLYFENAQHANEMAQKLAQGIKECGYDLWSDSPTNLIFPIFPKTVIEKLESNYGFYIWQPHDEEHSVIRLATSWATPESAVEEFIADLKKIN